MVCLTYRDTVFAYMCTCMENCYLNNQILCTINKNNRNTCKHCRYTKCFTTSGMDRKYVLDEDAPEVESKCIIPVAKRNSAPYKSDFHKYDLSSTKRLIDEMTQLASQHSLNDIEVNKIKAKQL